MRGSGLAMWAVALVSGASAFSFTTHLRTPQPSRSRSVFMQEDAGMENSAVKPPDAQPPPGMVEVKELWGADKKARTRIEGGSTLRTFQMPAHAERVQYILSSPSNRPVKARVELWIGPIRCVHTLIYDSMDGLSYPIKATLKFKKVSPVLKISTDGSYEFPLVCGVFVPSPANSKKLEELTTDMFYTAPLKDRVQGGSTNDNKGGAIRSFAVHPSWEKTQIMIWSKDVGKKSFKTNVEILQGPNNAKQKLDLQCGGSTQPYHAVINTPGPGWMIRCNSKKYLEDGLFEIAVAPYGEPNAGGYAPEDDVVMGGNDVIVGGGGF